MLAKILSLTIAAAGIACPAWFMWHAARGLPRFLIEGSRCWTIRPFLITLRWCLGAAVLCLLFRSVDLWLLFLTLAPVALGVALITPFARRS